MAVAAIGTIASVSVRRGRDRAQGLTLATLMVAVSLAVAAPVAAAGDPLVTVGIDVVSASASSVVYEIRVASIGTANAVNAKLSSAVPAHTTFSSSQPAPGSGGGSCANGGVPEPAGTNCVWDLGTLVPGAVSVVRTTLDLGREDATYKVEHSVTLTFGETRSVTDVDPSLTRSVIAAGDDSFVSDGDPFDTNHGACPTLRTSGDNAVVSFLDLEPLPTEQTIEKLWSAELRTVVESTTGTSELPHAVGLYPITSSEWSEGTGPCTNGTTGTGDQARTGLKPNVSSEPVSSANVSAADQVAIFDVLGGLDAPEERAGYQGWSVRSTSSSGHLTQFDSLESGSAAQTPRLVLVHTEPESATCIDLDPDTISVHPSSELVLTASVTDGARVVAGASDGCTGGKVGAEKVVWTLETQGVDSYISNTAGSGTSKNSETADAGPNTAETRSGEDGSTFIALRLDTPADSAGNEGDNRVSARIADEPDAAEPGSDPTCGLPPPGGKSCTGESDAEDDGTVTWALSATTAPTSVPTVTPSAGSTTSSPGTPAGSLSSREITLSLGRLRVVSGQRVDLQGVLSSRQAACAGAGKQVAVLARTLGTTERRTLATLSTDLTGAFSGSVLIRASADIYATVDADAICAAALSTPATVKAAALVTARASDDSVPRGTPFSIRGSVAPKHPRTEVVLQMKSGEKWTRVQRARLTRRSTFAFSVIAKWNGSRLFRVRWAGDKDHEPGRSRQMRIGTT